MGAYRTVVASADPGDRAGLIAAIYIVSYVATGVPAVIGGIATSRYGLSETALVYSLVVAAVAAVAVILLISRTRGGARAVRRTDHPDPPPGPGTVPPCPPARSGSPPIDGHGPGLGRRARRARFSGPSRPGLPLP
jgi:hypothetical protein